MDVSQTSANPQIGFFEEAQSTVVLCVELIVLCFDFASLEEGFRMILGSLILRHCPGVKKLVLQDGWVQGADWPHPYE